MLADSDKCADGLRVFESGDQVTFQSTGDAMAESRQFGTLISEDFSGVPRELGVVRRKVAVPLLNGVELPLSVLDTVEIAKGVFKDLYQGSKVREVDGVIFHIWRDLIQGCVLKAVDGKA